jgi:hypothetical protein
MRLVLAGIKVIRRLCCRAGLASACACRIPAAATMVMPVAGSARSAREQAAARTGGEQREGRKEQWAQQQETLLRDEKKEKLT